MLNWRKFANAPERSLIECSANKMMTKYAADGPLAHARVSVTTLTRLILLLAVSVAVSKAEPAVPVTPGPEIDQAFASMYDTNFPAAHKYLDRYIAAHPSDPFGYAVRSSAFLFSELDRLG